LRDEIGHHVNPGNEAKPLPSAYSGLTEFFRITSSSGTQIVYDALPRVTWLPFLRQIEVAFSTWKRNLGGLEMAGKQHGDAEDGGAGH
jgi:hypothetical protein